MLKIDKDQLLNDFQQYLLQIENMFQVSAEQLQKTEAQCRAIVDQAADAIVILNSKLEILTWNEGAEYIFGFQAAEVLGRSIDELITRVDVVDESATLSKKILAGEKIRSFEAIRYTKNGAPKNVIISGTSVKNSNGKIASICLIYKDITDLKKAQVNLVQSEKQATLGIIAGSIGHELNNLVGGMMIYTHMLRENPEDVAQVREFANILCEQLTSISVHAKNLLSLGKPVTPEIKKLDLIKLLRETTETLKISGLLKRFKIVNEFEDKLPLVQGDPHLLEQAIRNLEINSAHALEKKGTISVGARLAANPRFVEFFIKDDGPGIPDEIREKIFEKFFTTKSDGKGTGLGLSIVKQIVENHRGYLLLESEIGLGTNFIIGIPVAED
jgi:PAS domain S-box-containing protein